jgi:hypothetical protein
LQFGQIASVFQLNARADVFDNEDAQAFSSERCSFSLSQSFSEILKAHLFDSASLGLLPFLTLKRSRLGINRHHLRYILSLWFIHPSRKRRIIINLDSCTRLNSPFDMKSKVDLLAISDGS